MRLHHVRSILVTLGSHMEWPKGVAILRVLSTESVVSNMNNFYSLFLYFGTQKYFIFFNLDFLLRVETTAVLNQGFPTLKKKKKKETNWS